jgi:uncharacterized membrane protein YhiD involved in acid resistance
VESLIIIGFLISIIVILKIIFRINIKKAKSIQDNKELEKITDRFPENIEIVKDILKMLDNENVKIEEEKDTKTSLYIAISNKIIIADMKNNYARIQTIAHECAHSIQDKRILLANFIISNICILYYFIMLVLTICKVITNPLLHIIIFMLFLCIKLVIRTYLETEAMTKSRYISEKYIDMKNVCEEKEKEELLTKYDEINKMGIPFMIDSLVTSRIIWYFIVCNYNIFYIK